MSNSVAGSAFWLSSAAGALYAVHHGPPVPAPVRLGIVIVPPFGWDEVESHRARRYWAVRMAAAGFSVLRYDLPGTGDSEGSPRLPQLFTRWTVSVAAAVDWLRAQARVPRVAVIGIGSGGLIACQAVHEGAAADDLVLWAVRTQGHRAVREMRAYAGAVAASHPEDHEDHPVSDGTEVTGFYMSTETQDALSACDVGQMDFSGGPLKRVLLLGRDNLGIDPGLVPAFASSSVAVSALDTSDFHRLMEHPQSLVLRRPEVTIARSIEWLSAGLDAGGSLGIQPASPPTQVQTPRREKNSVTIAVVDGEVQETIVGIDLNGERGYAIVTAAVGEERAPVAALLMSPGAIRKIGQHRMWVELARRWALRGVTCVRIDLPNVGDTAGPGDAGEDEVPLVTNGALMSARSVAAVRSVVRQLREHNLGPRFVTVGHCSGAYLGFHVALDDADVVAYLSVDQQVFQFTEAAYFEHTLDLITDAVKDGLVRRLRERGVTSHEMAQVRQAVSYRLRHGRRAGGEQGGPSPAEMFDALEARGVHGLLLLVRDAELLPLMPEGTGADWMARWPHLRVEELPTADHMARALWLQQLTHDRLDAGLDRLLGSLAGDVTGAGDPFTKSSL
ncbi:MAG TPA: alpha/beta fold hydrolase [Solirubrobacteraceae bacterium]|nr:alpha/beta fold hydrolase [Solirubrobacteraceae bacterium]